MALELRARGWSEVYALRGGYDAWVAAGYPVEPRESVAPAEAARDE